jgi:hypothetical protein
MRLEELQQLESPITQIVIEPATFRFVALCPNQRRHCLPPFIATGYQIMLDLSSKCIASLTFELYDLRFSRR